MDVIVTHENADFDAVASLLAAARLYPTAAPLLPRRVNRNVQEFLTLYGEALPFHSLDEAVPEAIERVIAVDCQAIPSLKGLKPTATIHFIDHHPFDKTLPAQATHEGREVGATTTLLVQQLMKLPQSLSPIEAALLMLGIYEDTGSLSYKGTRVEDFQAATWLFERGASLDLIQEYLHHALSAGQQALYQKLIQAARAVEVAGYSVVIASARAGGHVEEVSTLAHHLRDLFACDALFVLAQMDGHVQVVARSTHDAIDVGAIMAGLGGGGHARAAAAFLRDVALEEAEARLRALCRSHIHPLLTAGQIMSRSVRTLAPEMPIREAEALFKRYGHEGFPVVNGQDELLGILTRREVDRAMHHQLGDMPIASYMHKGAIAVDRGEAVEQVRKTMIERGLGQVPVVQDGRLVGIVTRTDLIKMWGQPPASAQALRQAQEVVARFEAALPEDLLILIRAAGGVALKKNYLLYVVGGFVRDLLLSMPNSDIDLVVEGDAIKLARAMAARFGGHVHAHARFGTAKWMLDQRPVAQDQGAVRSLDFITARREFYTNPTALPQVEHSSIQQDLHRRDFTINTLAICLDELRFGQLLDFFGGLDDLHNGVIRVMHNLSFIEDPTRILRAARYEQRLGFRIEPRTAELMSDALGLFARVSGERLANELFLILAEAEPEKALSRLEEIGALGAIHADLHYSEATGMQMGRLRAALGRVEPLVSVGVLTHHLPLAGALGIAERLRLSKAQTTFIEQLNRLWHLESSLAAHDLAPSQLARSLEPFSPDAQTVAAALTDNLIVRERIERYQTQWRFEKPTTDGLRLQELGLSPGPVYRTILEAIRAARLDGIVSTAAEEEALALKLAAEHTQQDKEK